MKILNTIVEYEIYRRWNRDRELNVVLDGRVGRRSCRHSYSWLGSGCRWSIRRETRVEYDWFVRIYVHTGKYNSVISLHIGV